MRIDSDRLSMDLSPYKTGGVVGLYLLLVLVFVATAVWALPLFTVFSGRKRQAQASVLRTYSREEEATREGAGQAIRWERVGNRLLLPSERAWLEKKLDAIGSPSNALDLLLMKKAQYFAAGALCALLLLLSGAMSWLVAVFVLVASLFYVDINLDSKVKDFDRSTARQLPAAVDVLVLAVEAGMNFQYALGLLVESSKGPVIDQLARVLRSIELGDSRTSAFAAMRMRSGEQSLRNFANALIQAEALGVSLAPILREQAELLRKVQREKAREQAQKVPVKILFPVVLCFVPALLLFVLGPIALSFL